MIRAYLLLRSELRPPHLQTDVAEHEMVKGRGFLCVPELLDMAAIAGYFVDAVALFPLE